MKLDKVLPISLDHSFRRKTFYNFKTIEQQHNDLIRYIRHHHENGEHVHEAKQIDYLNFVTDTGLKVNWNMRNVINYTNNRVTNLVLGSFKDGRKEIIDGRVSTFEDNKVHDLISERLLADFLFVNSKIDELWSGMAYVNIHKLDVLEEVEEGYRLSSDNLLKIDEGYILYFPRGTYLLDEPVKNLSFGVGAKLFINDIEFELSAFPQQVNNVEQNSQRLNNLVTGINAGLNTNLDPINSYGNTVYGSEALKHAHGQRRNTMIGQDAGKELDSTYSATAVGAGALMESRFTDRGTYIGGNAGKWAGASGNIVGRHQLYSTPDINKTLNTYWPNWRDYAGKVDQPAFMANKRSDNQSNVAVGRNAQGFNITTKRSVGIGYNAMEQTLNGDGIVAIGENAFQYGLKAKYSTFVGGRAGWHMMDSYQDTVIGKSAAQELVHSSHNTIIGYGAAGWRWGNHEDKLDRNVVIGRNAMARSKGNAFANTVIGENAMSVSTDSKENTILGHSAGANNENGFRNTFIGANGGTQLKNAKNATALGYNALNNPTMNGYENITGIGQNSSVTGSNQLQLGNSKTTPYSFQAIQLRSDKRDKADIQETTLGLEFIKKLKPVEYRLDLREDYYETDENGEFIVDEFGNRTPIPKDGSKKRERLHQGFIAQDVQKITEDMGIDFAGLQHHEKDGGEDVYSIGYEEFIAPIINAIQEQNKLIEKQQNQINYLTSKYVERGVK